MLVLQPALAMGLGGIIMYHGGNFEKMTQYDEFGCTSIF